MNYSSSLIAVLFLKGRTYKTPGGFQAQIDFGASRVSTLAELICCLFDFLAVYCARVIDAAEYALMK